MQGNELSLIVGEPDGDDSPVSIKAYANTANFEEIDIAACQSVVHKMDAALISEGVSKLLKDDPNPTESRDFIEAGEIPAEILDAILEVEDAENARLPDPATINTAPGCDTIWRVIELRPELSMLKEALEKANLFTIISNPNLTATFFAPTNGAFKVVWILWVSRRHNLGWKDFNMVDFDFFNEIGILSLFHKALLLFEPKLNALQYHQGRGRSLTSDWSEHWGQHWHGSDA